MCEYVGGGGGEGRGGTRTIGSKNHLIDYKMSHYLRMISRVF